MSLSCYARVREGVKLSLYAFLFGLANYYPVVILQHKLISCLLASRPKRFYLITRAAWRLRVIKWAPFVFFGSTSYMIDYIVSHIVHIDGQ